MSPCESNSSCYRTGLLSLLSAEEITSHNRRTRESVPIWGTTSRADTAVQDLEPNHHPAPHQPLPLQCPCPNKRTWNETGLSCDNLNKRFYYLMGTEWHKPKKCRMSAVSGFLQDHWITRYFDSLWAACFVPHTSETCDCFALSPLDWKYCCATAAKQPHWTLKFALPEVEDCIWGLQWSLPSYTFPWDQAVSWHSSLCCLCLWEIGQKEHDLLPYFSHTWACARCTLERTEHHPAQPMPGESHPEGAVSTMFTVACN